MLSLNNYLNRFKSNPDKFYSFLFKLANAVINLCVVMFVVDFYSSNISDEYFTLLSVCMLTSVICRLGADSLIVREVGKYTNEKNTEIPKSIIWIFLIIILCHFLIFSLYFIVENKFHLTSNNFFPLILSIILFSINITVSFIFQGLSRIKDSILMNLMIPNIFFIIINFMSNLNDVGGILYVYSFSLLLSILFSISRIIAHGLKFNETRTVLPSRNSYLDFSVLTIIGQILIWSPQIFLAINENELEITAFSVFQRLSLTICFILTAINYIYAPIYAKLFKQNDLTRLVRISKITSLVMLIFSTPLFIFIVIFSDNIINMINPFLIGYKFEFFVICLSQFFNVLAGSVGYILNMSNNERYVKVVMVYSLVGYIFGSIIFVPIFGLTASVIIYSSCIVFQNCALLFVIKSKMGFLPIIDLASIRSVFINPKV